MAVSPINDLPEPSHRHLLVPLREERRIDQTLHVWSLCVCGLEERRSFQVDDAGEPLRPTRVEYRLGGRWMSALDLIRRRDLPVDECEACRGAGCQACVGLGVVEVGALGQPLGPVRATRPAPPSAPAAPAWYDPDRDELVPVDDAESPA